MSHPGSLQFIVQAEPRSQGSMTAVYNHQLGISRVRHANAPALSLWRTQVRAAARAAGAAQWDGPIGMRMVFGLHAPQDRRHGYPKRPDLDKLVRAVLDSLTGVCYSDDSQVIRLRASKIWASYTLIEVWQIERQTAQGQTTLFKGNA